MGERLSEQLFNLLDEYCSNVDDVVGIGISTTSGLEISSHFDSKVNENLAHAVASLIYKHTHEVAKRLDYRGFLHNLTYTEDGIIALLKVDKDIVILILMESNADVNNALIKMDKIITKIKHPNL